MFHVESNVREHFFILVNTPVNSEILINVQLVPKFKRKLMYTGEDIWHIHRFKTIQQTEE